MDRSIRSIVLSTLLLLSTAAHANWEGNFLLGIDGGYGWRNGTANFSISPPTSATPTTAGTIGLNDNGFVFGILGGYQAMCKDFLLGIEANFSWQNFGTQHNFSFVDASNNPYNATGKFERNEVFGLTARAGYQLADWVMPYVRAGAETSNDTIDFTAVRTGSTVAISNTDRGVRLVLGAGLEFPMYLQSVIRVEYDYSSDGRGAAGTAVTAQSTTTSVTSFTVNSSPSQNLVKVQLVWNFM